MRTLIKLFTKIIVVLVLSIMMITSKPFEKDFVEWYVAQNQQSQGAEFDETFVQTVKEKIVTTNYILFSVYEVNEEERYVGAFGHFWGKHSWKHTAEVFKVMLKSAQKATEESNIESN